MAFILNLAILDSEMLVFPLKLTHTCQDWFPLFSQKKLHSFILTELDDGSHLEFCHLGFSHFAKKLWLKLVQSDSNSLILTQLDDGSHLEFCHYGFSYFAQIKLHWFFLTQLDDCRHLEFCPVGFRDCHLGFRWLVIFSQIHSKTLSLHSDSDSN